jgi:hypothetical protein
MHLRSDPRANRARGAVDFDHGVAGELSSGTRAGDDCRYPMLTGEDRDMAQGATGLGHQAAENRDHRRQPRVEGGDHEHGAGLRVGRVEAHPAAPHAPADRGPAALRTVGDGDRGAVSGQPEGARKSSSAARVGRLGRDGSLLAHEGL